MNRQSLALFAAGATALITLLTGCSSDKNTDTEEGTLKRVELLSDPATCELTLKPDNGPEYTATFGGASFCNDAWDAGSNKPYKRFPSDSIRIDDGFSQPFGHPV